MLTEILKVLEWVFYFYLTLSIYMLINMVITATIIWILLLLYRLLGIPWFDGTTKGFINRE